MFLLFYRHRRVTAMPAGRILHGCIPVCPAFTSAVTLVAGISNNMQELQAIHLVNTHFLIKVFIHILKLAF